MRKIILFCICCLFVFVSCGNNLDDLYNSGDYQKVFDDTSSLLKDGFSKNALYYKALSSNRLGLNTDSANAAELYVLLYPDQDDKNIAMHRMILHYGDISIALDSGEYLEGINQLSKEDSIQYYKILIDNGLYVKANSFLSTLTQVLTKAELVFCLINGDAPIWQITNALVSLYQESGCSNTYLSAIRALILSFETSEIDSVEAFLENTFDGNSQYAIIIGDFYFSINKRDKMLYYWNLAKDDYPEAIDARLKIVK